MCVGSNPLTGSTANEDVMMQPFVAAVLISLSSTATTQSDLALELEQAKALYQSASFIRAVQALGAVVRVLDERPDVDNGEAMRVEGHLYLDLTYFALQDSEAATESFANVLRLRPGYTLDADIYPPRVRALFEKARRETDVTSSAPSTVSTPANDINEFQILYDNWSFFAPLDGDEDRITREDLEIFQNSPDVVKRHPELAAASEFFLENPTFFDRADVGKGNRYNLGGSGDLDGEISRDDLMQCLDWGEKGPLGRFDPDNPTPEDAARTFLHWFELLDIGAGRGELDGTISYRDLEDFYARNPGAPDELANALRYVLANEVVLSQLDSANDSDGDVDGKISLQDLERVRS